MIVSLPQSSSGVDVVLPPKALCPKMHSIILDHNRLEVLSGSRVKQRSCMQGGIAHAGFVLFLKSCSCVLLTNHDNPALQVLYR